MLCLAHRMASDLQAAFAASAYLSRRAQLYPGRPACGYTVGRSIAHISSCSAPDLGYSSGSFPSGPDLVAIYVMIANLSQGGSPLQSQRHWHLGMGALSCGGYRKSLRRVVGW